MNINYGLMPLVEAPKRDADGRRLGSKVRSQGRKLAMGERALADLAAWASDAPGQHSAHQSQAVSEI
jgi:methylenetetrahydrofolate--tRNA-(uracil-5-)-methyltransferase